MDISDYEDMGFDKYQLDCIEEGLKYGLDVSVYADPKLDVWEMGAIITGLKVKKAISTDSSSRIRTMCDVAERLEQMGIKKGRLAEIFDSVQAGDYSARRGAEKASMEIAEFKLAMKAAGYDMP